MRRSATDALELARDVGRLEVRIDERERVPRRRVRLRQVDRLDPRRPALLEGAERFVARGAAASAVRAVTALTDYTDSVVDDIREIRGTDKETLCNA